MDRFGIQEPEHVLNLGVDETAKSYMLETARWGKFLAILSFIGIGLLFLAGLGSAFVLNTYQQQDLPEGFGYGMLVIYLAIGLIYLYPGIAMYRFSRSIKLAIETHDQQQFNTSLRYLRNIFKFFGIVAIITLSIYGLAIIFMILAAAFNA